MDRLYDVIVIGGGPAGYTAALYAARAGFQTLVLEKLVPGGQMALTAQIDNYPGFPEGTDGVSLGEQMKQGAERFGAKTVYAEVRSLVLTGDRKEAVTAGGSYFGRTVVLAMGAEPRRLKLPDEERLTGRGISYCALCDGMFYKDKTVVVAGGGNSAAADALILSRICKQVRLVHRRDTLRADPASAAALKGASNLEFLWNTQIKEVFGEDRLEGVLLFNKKTGEEQRVFCDGLFVSIGREPASALVSGQVETDSAGYLLAGEDTRTSVPGVFAAGDIRTKAVRQIVTAVADGAFSVHEIEQYFMEKDWRRP